MSIYTKFFLGSNSNYKIFYYKMLLITSIIALVSAYYVEFVMDLPPCVLCLYQRYCYFALIIGCLFAIFIQLNKYIILYSTLILLLACGISGYHSGVERNLFAASAHCSSQIVIPDNLSVNEIKTMLYNKPIASCQKAALKILGLSMSEWNLLLNILLLITLVFTSYIQPRSNAKA